ncbi:hypothetical protein F5Y17DRAFT_42835 [Xylariaceae sp. FL0594]|nr:hypothetical protein F5Y17DRAFT_42835 [Xylariaceae sp. FL0594]
MSCSVSAGGGSLMVKTRYLGVAFYSYMDNSLGCILTSSAVQVGDRHTYVSFFGVSIFFSAAGVLMILCCGRCSLGG